MPCGQASAHVPTPVPVARPVPRAVREPVRRARALADPERRRRGLRRVDRGSRPVADPRRASGCRGRARSRPRARAHLAPGTDHRREHARRVRLGGERRVAVVRVARARAAAAVGGDRHAPDFRRRRVGRVERARAPDEGGRPHVCRAANGLDRGDAGDRRRCRGRLATRVRCAPAACGLARRESPPPPGRPTLRSRAWGPRSAVFSDVPRLGAGRSASCSRRQPGRGRSSTAAPS